MTSAPLPPEPRNQIDDPSSLVARFGADEPLMMDAGVALAPWQIAYQTYGSLNRDKSNAVLICHALTGDQHVANMNPVTGKPGWWTTMVGPGRPVDTNRFFERTNISITPCPLLPLPPNREARSTTRRALSCASARTNR